MAKKTAEMFEEVNTEEMNDNAEEANDNAEAAHAVEPYDPWKDMRKVYIPKRSRGEQSTLEVGVNDKTYFIPKDQFVEVPEPVWEVVREMQARQKIMEEEAKKESERQKAEMARFA